MVASPSWLTFVSCLMYVLSKDQTLATYLNENLSHADEPLIIGNIVIRDGPVPNLIGSGTGSS